ncbi:protein CDV3 homolog isoform X2 [Onthophagus taurus]|uniref:protein CDV3 homolog isoform X2 n=1 Tax=Onthophagus taurus TaxID=166361 RepID=UPI000C20C9F6|nr:protein CDV3 homolog isoform X2 [Onthophagus taurus]XP_022913807.1 protein CDV3 homolog isoform X2 [Onthophagus taurus]
MADLDDFFAKKDRKKSKTKKFATTDEVAKKLEDTKKIEKPAKKERPPEGEEGVDPVPEQDEWKEFEEEKKDYTGLKIGNLTINSNGDGTIDCGENNGEQQQRYDESGNEVEKKVGPWKRIEVVPVEVQPEKEVRKAPEPPAAVSTSAYVPPSLRNVQQPQPLHQVRGRSKAAPDIHNEEQFPTFAGSKSDKRGRNEGSFEVVSHNKASSYRHVEQTKLASSQGPRLALGNRYNTLSDS